MVRPCSDKFWLNYADYDVIIADLSQSNKNQRLIPIQIILVHSITKFYHSSPSCYREMQGDARLHHPPRNGMLRDPPPTGIGLSNAWSDCIFSFVSCKFTNSSQKIECSQNPISIRVGLIPRFTSFLQNGPVWYLIWCKM